VLALDVDPAYEHGVLADTGVVRVDGTEVKAHELAYLAPGSGRLTLEAGDDGARLLLLGGPPFAEPIVMWWNFVGRSHDEIEAYRAEWQADVIARGSPSGRFGTIEDAPAGPLPAPVLPNVRLRPRD
jgi:redox-sensitive bicupin YhaK (pirin superfamily)